MYGIEAETKRSDSYPEFTVRNTRERRRNREIGELPRIVGSKFPAESESKKRRVLTIRQVCVNTRKSSAGSGSIKISKTASDKVTTGASSRYGEKFPMVTVRNVRERPTRGSRSMTSVGTDKNTKHCG